MGKITDKTHFTFIRHLKTPYNKNGLLQGSLDISISPPSQEDILDIQKNKTELEGEVFDNVYCSGLKRTQETALFYGYENYIIEPSINELNFGHYEGNPKEHFNGKDKDLWLNKPEELILGESLKSFFHRIDQFIVANNNSKLLIFSHGVIMRYLKSKYILGDISKMNKIVIENNSMFRLSI